MAAFTLKFAEKIGCAFVWFQMRLSKRFDGDCLDAGFPSHLEWR